MQKSLKVLRLYFGEQPDCDRTSMMVSSEPLAEQPLAELQSGMQDRLAMWNARLTIGEFVFIGMHEAGCVETQTYYFF